ncbi:MAG: eL32 family ribosomal protein, partial [Candidatus Bathyarchaeia archaeon]
MSSETEGLEEAKKAIELRRKIKEKKPDFIRQESWRYDRVDDSWRRPKGIDSKMRREVKGWPARVKIGYRGPRKARGLHPSAYREVIVYN